MSFIDKRQSKSPFMKRWRINKTRSISNQNNPLRLSSLSEKYKNNVTPKQQNKSECNSIKLQHSFDINCSPFITAEPTVRAFTSLQKSYQKQQQEYLDIDKLQMQVDRLLKEKMKLLIGYNKDKAISKAKNIPINGSVIRYLIDINCQLQTLMTRMQNSLTNNTSTKNINKWEQFDQNIKIIQKMIAQNYSEVQIMKQYYGTIGHTSTAYKKFCKQKERSKVNAIKDKHLLLNKQKIANILSPTKALPFITQAKTSYKSLDKHHYILKHKNVYQSKNKDSYQTIIETSAYKRSFKQYPYHNIPKANQRHSSLPMNPFVKSLQTSYSTHYQSPPKSKVQKPNYKKFESFKDKIKPVSINFIANNKQNVPSLNDSAEYIKMNRSINKALTQPAITFTPAFHTTKIPFFNMQAGEQKLYKARPKNNRLQNLKTSYRFMSTIQ